MKLSTEHSIILCVERRERVVALETLLKQAGIVVHIANSVYDAVRLAEQELPHLIISEPSFADGTASNLYDKLNQHQHLKRIPMALLFSKLAKDEAAALVKRRLAGLFSNNLDPRAIVEKSLKILRGESGKSPHFIEWDSSKEQNIVFSSESNFIGKVGSFAVSRANFEVETSNEVRCVIKSGNETVALLQATTNIRDKEGVYTLFPFHRLLGSVRAVLSQLPDLVGGEKSKVKGSNTGGESSIPRVVVALTQSEDEFKSWQNVLSAYGWKLLHAANAAAVAAIVGKSRVAAIWVLPSEGRSDSGLSPELKAVYTSISLGIRPVILLHAKNSDSISKENISYILPDFGLGAILDLLDASLWRASDLSAAGSPSSHSSITASWSDRATLIGCDERSWYMESQSPLARGSKVVIKQSGSEPFWTSLNLQVGACTQSTGELFLLRLDIVSPGASKLRYFEKVTRELRIGIKPAA